MGDKFKNISNSKINNRNKLIIKNSKDKVGGTINIKEKIIELISKNKINESINLLIEYFKNKKNDHGLNSMIMISSQNFELHQKKIHNTISLDNQILLRNKIRESILEVVRNEIK